jgi:hypothetical protein
MTSVTKSYIEDYLFTHSNEQNMHFIGRALVAIFNFQTEDEKRASDTREDNGIGFTGADGHSGCISAKYYLKHKRLEDWQVDRWLKKNKKGTRRISKYWRQLDAAAKAKGTVKKLPKTVDPTYHDKFKNIDADWMEAKDAFAQHEREMEAQAYMRKNNVNTTVARRSIRRAADQRSL